MYLPVCVLGLSAIPSKGTKKHPVIGGKSNRTVVTGLNLYVLHISVLSTAVRQIARKAAQRWVFFFSKVCFRHRCALKCQKLCTAVHGNADPCHFRVACLDDERGRVMQCRLAVTSACSSGCYFGNARQRRICDSPK